MLDKNQAYIYLTSSGRKCKPSIYVEKYYTKNTENCLWWLRTSEQGYAAFVSDDGNIYDVDGRSFNAYIAVRPAVWVDLES